MIDDVATVALQQAVAGLGMRQQVTANNVANLETRGFTAQNLDFESSLADAVAAGDPARASVTTNYSANPAGVNGNNVSLSDEIVTATKTGLEQQLVTNALTAQYGLISTVLKG